MGILFNGTSQYIELPTAGVGVAGQSKVSFTTWLKLTGAPSALNFVLYESGAAGTWIAYSSRCALFVNTSCQIVFGGRDATAEATDGAAFVNKVSSTVLTIGQWYFICGVWDAVNDRIDLYINGSATQGGAATIGAFSASDSTRRRFAAASSGAPQDGALYFGGRLFDTRMYLGLALTAAQARIIYREQGADKLMPHYLHSRWMMIGPTGQTVNSVTDMYGNGTGNPAYSPVYCPAPLRMR